MIPTTKYHIREDIDVPPSIQDSWQETLDLLAEIISVPAALIMRVHAGEIEVFGRSHNADNVYEKGETSPLNAGLYCETVMDRQEELLVPNALADPEWDDNPDTKLGMISYLGLPIRWPEGEIFGTICILDNKENRYSGLQRRLLGQFRNVIELALANIFDVHQERSRDREGLRESEEQFRVLATSAVDAVIMMDPDGKASFWNQAAERMFGYQADEALGQDLHFLVAADEERERFRQRFIEFRKRGEGPIVNQTVECVSKRKDGSDFPVELSVSAVMLKGKWNAIGIVRDISERKTTEARLRQADKMDALGNLAGGIAHDLKNMLFPILNLTRMTLKTLPEGSHERTRLEKVVEATERAKTLVEKIHAFSHKDEAKREPIEFRDVVEETLELLRSTLPTTIEIRSEFCPDECNVWVDVPQVETAIMNLATNGADAMEGSVGTLSLTVQATDLGEPDLPTVPVPGPGPYVRLTVADTGMGIDEATCAHIFEPYFTTKERGHGTGLGLALVQKIAMEHGGVVTVSSTLGKGTAFDVYLPIVGDEEV